MYAVDVYKLRPLNFINFIIFHRDSDPETYMHMKVFDCKYINDLLSSVNPQMFRYYIPF